MSSPSSAQLAAPPNFEQSENGSNLHSTILFTFFMGIYTMVYFGTLYLYLARKTAQRHIVIATITALYIFNVIIFAGQWWLIQWEFITNGQTQDSIYVAYMFVSPEWLNLVIDVMSVLTIVLADGLLIWRCYYVCNRSIRILALLLVLWIAEFGISVSSLAIQGVIGGTNATHQLAVEANDLVSAQYFMSFFTSVVATCLIAYKIISVSKQSVTIGISSGRQFRHILDIVVQSSVIYSLALLLIAIGFVLPEEVGDGRNTRGIAFFNYSTALAYAISGLAPTVMVARVALLATDRPDPSSGPHLSNLNFGGNSTSYSDAAEVQENSTVNSNSHPVSWDIREKHAAEALEA
ncbi:hypothetical protein CPB84DRAFT_1849891 [Gymnopilus junonius]|uniref:Uncharacterized protein n=1 Tax=Gymnopilus junonius TaxID=109634 RepID=A0A9P5NGP6_GYMJU|nr:hypothetical protein CPB84DRAFT_1849891 [Gymnopilus junonius]